MKLASTLHQRRENKGNKKRRHITKKEQNTSDKREKTNLKLLWKGKQLKHSQEHFKNLLESRDHGEGYDGSAMNLIGSSQTSEEYISPPPTEL